MVNINLDRENVTVVDGYFVYFQEYYDTLFYKTDDGIQGCCISIYALC